MYFIELRFGIIGAILKSFILKTVHTDIRKIWTSFTNFLYILLNVLNDSLVAMVTYFLPMLLFDIP